MQNKDFSAGTKDDQRTTADNSTSASVEANPMLSAVLSKSEAIELMKKGKRVTHRYFLDDEWISMRGNIIYMELGQECWSSEFWKCRTDSAWETDWSVYGR